MNCAYFDPIGKPTVFTMGYEGASIEDFVATLIVSKVDTIIDVREYPISRKKGFSKTAFSNFLNAYGIKYIHLVDLGCPKPIRDQYKNDKNWENYTKSFLEYLNTQTKYIDELGKLSERSNFCLVCFERDQNFCHRSIIANAIKDRYATQVKHLGSKKGLAETHLELVEKSGL